MIPMKPKITSKRIATGMPPMEEEDNAGPNIDNLSLEELHSLREMVDQKIVELEAGEEQAEGDNQDMA